MNPLNNRTRTEPEVGAVVVDDAGTGCATPPVEPATGSGVSVGAAPPVVWPVVVVEPGTVMVGTGAMVGRGDRSRDVVLAAEPGGRSA
jgi:hypothetical protein